MRTQASRLPGEPGRPEALGRTLDPAANWADDTPPRELTGGWPAIRLDEPRETQQFRQVRADRPLPGVAAPSAADSFADSSWTPSVPLTGSWSSAPPPPAPPTSPSPPPERDRWSSPLSDFDLFGPAQPAAGSEERRSRHAADEPGETAPSPWEWLSARELIDAPPAPPAPPQPSPPPAPAQPVTETAPRPSPRPSPRPRPSARPAVARSLPEVPPRRRRTGDVVVEPGTAVRPVASGGPPPAPQPVENAAAPPSGGRRHRRRYREDGEQDDVLARVLGDN
jgi:hypothetical protein